jgi:hypothetical protein
MSEDFMSVEDGGEGSGSGQTGPEVLRVWGRSPSWALSMLPRFMAYAFAALSAALIVMAVFTWRPEACPALGHGVREVPVAASLAAHEPALKTGAAAGQPDAPTPPGAAFPASHGQDGEVIDALLIGAGPGRRVDPPWRIRAIEAADGSCPAASLLDDPVDCHRPGECPTSDPAPVARANESCWVNGVSHGEGNACSFEPAWLVSTGLEAGPGDVTVAFRSTRRSYRHDSCDEGQETVETLHLARGPEPMWRHAELADPPPGAPIIRFANGDVVACFPEGFYRVGGMYNSTWYLERWPLRARLTPSAPLWPAWLVALALAGCAAIVLKGSRARRHLRDKVGAGTPRPAVVSDLSPSALHLDVAGEGPLEVPWQQVVDVFRRQGCLMMNMAPDERDFFFPKRQLREVPLELSLARTGGKVQVVLVSGARDRQPYRAGAAVSEGLTLVLHDDVTLPQVLAMVNDVNQGALWSWIIAIVGAVGLIATLTAL